MKLIAWLGNPWEKYKLTRHNIWFYIIDLVCERYWFSKFDFNKKYNAEISEWEIDSEKFIAIKPMSYMNLSWWSVAMIKNFYKIDNNDILVIYDDIDIDPARIRIKKSWSAWWHNWVSDIINKIWTQDFWRLKIWVWRPLHKEQVADYVLSKFKKEELDDIMLKFDEILEYISRWNKWKI